MKNSQSREGVAYFPVFKLKENKHSWVPELHSVGSEFPRSQILLSSPRELPSQKIEGIYQIGEGSKTARLFISSVNEKTIK